MMAKIFVRQPIFSGSWFVVSGWGFICRGDHVGRPLDMGTISPEN